MNSINWQQFGLRKNPYDTIPLIEGGDLPIEKAFVGRNVNGWTKLKDKNGKTLDELKRQ